jgi:protein ATS1
MQRLFAFGSNGSGQLGIGHRDDVSEATECLFCDDTYTTATSDNEKNSNGEERVLGRKVKRISCGGNHTLILFEDGAVYAAGLNEDLRCGVCSTTTTKSGLGQGVGKDEDGIITRFKGVSFRLRATGPGTEMVIDRFKDVCATWSASCFVATITLNNDGDKKDIVISLGTGDKGELGLRSGRRMTPSETTVDGIIDVDDYVLADFPPSNTRIEAISSGTNHVVAILSNGDVYGWGASRKGQLGNESEIVGKKIVWAPVKIDLTALGFVPKSVSCGREFTFIGGYKKVETGVGGVEYMYTILGTDDKWSIISAAPPVQTLQKSSLSENRYDVSTSWHGIYLHDTLDKAVVAWGRNDRGQLGVHEGSSVTQQSLVRWESVAQFMAGSEHAIAVLSDNRTVVSCGWGEHGNCGPDTDERGNVKGRLSRIRLPADVLRDKKAKVVQVAAGCATSWIVVLS